MTGTPQGAGELNPQRLKRRLMIPDYDNIANRPYGTCLSAADKMSRMELAFPEPFETACLELVEEIEAARPALDHKLLSSLRRRVEDRPKCGHFITC
jgi:hypothetical protein